VVKPECNLSECDGNVFAIIGRVRRVLKRADMGDKAEEFSEKAKVAASYDDVLKLCFDYVEVT
jgi:hypothetical protein